MIAMMIEKPPMMNFRTTEALRDAARKAFRGFTQEQAIEALVYGFAIKGKPSRAELIELIDACAAWNISQQGEEESLGMKTGKQIAAETLQAAADKKRRSKTGA